MSDTPLVTIGVPVYMGGAFVNETLQSIQNQTFKDIKVVISLDGKDSESEQVCQPYLSDSRFNLFIQPKRLGWVDNINWLMQQAKTPFWCCIPHDDLITPQYIEVLLDYTQKTPQASVTYCDIEFFGIREGLATQNMVTGDGFLRQFQLLYQHHSAIAFRGLTRIEAIQLAGNIRKNRIDSFSTDTVWMANMARWGELHRISSSMYKKRIYADSTHAKWGTWENEKMLNAWIIHCVDMLEQALLTKTTPQNQFLLWMAAVDRLLSPKFKNLHKDQINPENHSEIIDRFLKYAENSGYIKLPSVFKNNWSSINHWTKLTIEKIYAN